jgi:hypothetical protein
LPDLTRATTTITGIESTIAPTKRTAISMFSSLCCHALVPDHGTDAAPLLAGILEKFLRAA